MCLYAIPSNVETFTPAAVSRRQNLTKSSQLSRMSDQAIKVGGTFASPSCVAGGAVC
jgi:hypothetical protein